MATRAITTAEQLFEAGDIGPCELVRGEVVPLIPPGGEHGRLVTELVFALRKHVDEFGGGTVYAEVGFILERNPDTVRAPDVAYIRAERTAETSTVAYIPGAPDLAVEVLSPNDRAPGVEEKVRAWLRAGCAEVWVVDPRARTVTVHAANGTRSVLRGRDTLACASLPGFALPLADLFT